MMRIAMIIFILLITGCATVPQGSIIGSEAWYTQKIQEIDLAFSKGEIDRETQISLKNEADMMRLMYQRDIDRQLRLNSRPFYNRPVYDCNAGVCTPLSP